MSTTTSNLELTKWADTDYVNFEEMNENFQKIDYSLADGIVEIGTEGNWQYRKWRSGFLELYISETVRAELNISEKEGNLYYAHDYLDSPYPSFASNLKVVGIALDKDLSSSSQLYIPTFASFGADRKIWFYIASGSASGTFNGKVNIHMIGRWK